MRILPDPLRFEWDKGNIGKSLKKHGISDKEAEETFTNEPKFILDSERLTVEERFMLWGSTNQAKKVTVIFTLREDRIRIISARPMSRKERRRCEKEI